MNTSRVLNRNSFGSRTAWFRLFINIFAVRRISGVTFPSLAYTIVYATTRSNAILANSSYLKHLLRCPVPSGRCCMVGARQRIPAKVKFTALSTKDQRDRDGATPAKNLAPKRLDTRHFRAGLSIMPLLRSWFETTTLYVSAPESLSVSMKYFVSVHGEECSSGQKQWNLNSHE